jgi:hypothetical protein
MVGPQYQTISLHSYHDFHSCRFLLLLDRLLAAPACDTWLYAGGKLE